jgi:hypothetical protein
MRGSVLSLEVIEVNYWFPAEGLYKPHPALVVSNADLMQDEFLFYGLLMTTKNVFPKYTIKIKPEWLTKTPHKEGYFATHIMEPFTMNDVLKRTNTFLKPEYFPLIRTKIIQSVFYNG